MGAAAAADRATAMAESIESAAADSDVPVERWTNV